MKIIKFKYSGTLSRKPHRSYLGDFAFIDSGAIALQLQESRLMSTTNWVESNERKEIVPVMLDDGSIAYAICAPGGWSMWVKEL